MGKKPLAFILGFVIAVFVVIYVVRSRSAASAATGPSKLVNPDIGARGGATQVDTETH